MTALDRHLTDEIAQRLLEGSLPAGEAGIAEAHAAGCAGCAALVESYRILSSALDDLSIEPPPGDFTEGVLARIDLRERAAARERRHGLSIFAGVVLATLGAFALAGPGAWAPEISALAERVGDAARAFQIGGSFVPDILGALRVQILVVSAVAAVPLLLLLSRFVPSPEAESA